MFYNYYLIVLSVRLLPISATDNSGLVVRADCNEIFSRCSPDGATTSDTPAIGNSLSTLYVDLLNSINKVQNVERDLDNKGSVLSIRASGSICCITFQFLFALGDAN